jgi:fibronectin-binding autotransporter adhesin
MSALLTTKLVTPCGDLGDTTTTNIVDAAGNLKTSSQFIQNKVVDYAGNLGQIIATGPWEMQLGSVETIGQNLGGIGTNYVNANNLSSFASVGCTGYMNGNISGSGTFTINGGTDTIGGVSYQGSGLQIFTGVNTCTGILNMEAGTNIQLGATCSNNTTRWAGNLTIGAGATATQYTSYTGNTYLCQALTNTGTYNVIGCGVCGQGGLGLATTVANNGVINIEKASWRNQSTWSGTGTVNVKDGGTFQLTTNGIGSTTTVNINGCGWCDASGNQIGAINGAGTGATYAMKIVVQTAACIKFNAGCNGVFGGILAGSAPLNIGTLSTTKPNGTVHFTNSAANTYNGTMTVDGVLMNASYNLSLQYAKIVLAGGTYMASAATQTIGSLASTDPTTSWRIGDYINCFIKANGITTYAGKLLMTGGNVGNVYLEGGSGNQLTITSTGNTCSVFPRNGSKLILQGATFTGVQGQIRVSGGSTLSAGTSTTASIVLAYIDATSGLDVRAVGASTGILNTGTGTSSLSNGWKVNLLDPLPAGTHVIWKNTGAAITQLPVIGTNLSGRTVTGFAWNNAVIPRTLSVTLV